MLRSRDRSVVDAAQAGARCGAAYLPDERRVVGGKAGPAGWRDEQSNPTELDQEQARQVLARAEREGAEHGGAGT